ncbi:MAG: ABC transporter ATP-binding protein/permease [Clostridia bacterium]
MIQAKNLTKEYENGYKAIDNLTFCLPNTGIVCIVGESGSGKTTLLNCMRGKLPFDGSIEVNGVEVAQKDLSSARNDMISMIYQDFRLLENLTVEDNLRLSCELAGDEFSPEYLDNLLDKVNLKDRLVKSKCKTLSGGEKQRVAIARALAQKTKIIFADEPTGNLDSKNSKVIFDLFKELSKDILIVVVTHNKKLMQEYADYYLCLQDGKIVETNLQSDDICSINAENCAKTERERDNVLPQKDITTQANLSKKSKLLIMRLPFKSKAVAICMASIFAVFLCITFVLGSTFYFDENVLFGLNAKAKNECVVTIKNNATRLEKSFLENSKIRNACYSFQNDKFVINALPTSDDLFLDENYVKFTNEITSYLFVECDDVKMIGGKLLAGDDVKRFDEIVINESMAYYLRALGEFDGKKIESYPDLLGLKLGEFKIVGILDAQYDRINEKYLDLTRNDFLALPEEEHDKAQSHKSIIEANNSVNMLVVSRGHSEHFRNTYQSLNNNTAKYKASFRTRFENVELEYERQQDLNYYNVDGELVNAELQDNEIILPKKYFDTLSLDSNFRKNYSLNIDILSSNIATTVKGYTDKNIVFVSPSLAEKQKNIEKSIFNAVNFSSKNSLRKNIKNFSDKIELDYPSVENSRDNQLIIQTAFSADIDAIASFYGSFKAIFIVSFALFGVVAALFGFTLAHLLLSRIQNEVGILLSIGLDKNTAKNVLSTALFILCAVAIFVATALYLAIIFVANYLFGALASGLSDIMFFCFPAFVAVIAVALIVVYCVCAYDKTIKYSC